MKQILTSILAIFSAVSWSVLYFSIDGNNSKYASMLQNVANFEAEVYESSLRAVFNISPDTAFTIVPGVAAAGSLAILSLGLIFPTLVQLWKRVAASPRANKCDQYMTRDMRWLILSSLVLLYLLLPSFKLTYNVHVLTIIISAIGLPFGVYIFHMQLDRWLKTATIFGVIAAAAFSTLSVSVGSLAVMKSGFENYDLVLDIRPSISTDPCRQGVVIARDLQGKFPGTELIELVSKNVRERDDTDLRSQWRSKLVHLSEYSRHNETLAECVDSSREVLVDGNLEDAEIYSQWSKLTYVETTILAVSFVTYATINLLLLFSCWCFAISATWDQRSIYQLVVLAGLLVFIEPAATLLLG